MTFDLLTGVTVVELRGNLATSFCGRLFAAFGARVVKVADALADETSEIPGASIYLDAEKEQVAGTGRLAELMASADVIVGAEAPPEIGDAAVFVRLTDFPVEGPTAAWLGSSLIAHAAGGYLFRNGDPDREPLRGLALQPYAQVALGAFVGALAALLQRDHDGRGQVVSAAVTDALATIEEWAIVRYTHGGAVQTRLGNHYSVLAPAGIYPTADGHIALSIFDQARSDIILALAGHPEAVGDPRYTNMIGRRVRHAEYDALIGPWLAATPTANLIAQFEDVKITAAPVLSIEAVLNHPQFVSRGTFREVEAGGRTIRIPGDPVHWTEGRDAGDGATWPARGVTEAGALGGLRVLDLTTGWSGPHGCRLLADLGAAVVKVEPPWARGTDPPDEEFVRESAFYMHNDPTPRHWMTSGVHNGFGYNKKSVALRMDEPRGRDVFRRLLEWADVVIDNYSTQAWEKLGLTFDEVAAVNPALIAVTMPGYGRSGPAKYRVSYGNQIEAETGAVSVMGYAGGGPQMFAEAWPDPCAGFFAAACAIAGAWRRQRTGRGQFFEICQAESGISLLGEEFVDYGLRGEQRPRAGNRHPLWAPHGVYRCAGVERWLAIAVQTDEQWRRLCGAMSRIDLAEASKLAGAAGRRANADAIDEAIAAWTAGCDAFEAMRSLQAAGVPAHVALDPRDMAEDRGLNERNAIVDVLGEPLPGFPFTLSRTPPKVHRGLPDIGEHNTEVLTSAGLTADEVRELEREGILGRAPDVVVG